MGFFGKKEAPVRRDQVLRLVQRAMEEDDAIHSVDDYPERWQAAARRRDAEFKNSTSAEIAAANNALKRHGY